MKIIGLMSGTSLDGVDVALCEFSANPSTPSASDAPNDGGVLFYSILAAETFPYPQQWRDTLLALPQASALDYAFANVQLGHFFGSLVREFLQKHPAHVDYIASHGHTIFHQPALGLTTQIGDGEAIAAETGIPVIYNFRNLDVALGGQGAPLVPIGDRLLFSQYDGCLNLGGIANISFNNAEGQRIAFDICPCNMALNSLANRVGEPFDRDGILASSGTVSDALLTTMDALDYYGLQAPKSLGREWYECAFAPLLAHGAVPELLATTVAHIARQVGAVIRQNGLSRVLVTGGGALNAFLIRQMQAQVAPHCMLEVPPREVVEYKEALVFALLGYLRVQGRTNTLRSVTGASSDSCGGSISGLVAGIN